MNRILQSIDWLGGMSTGGNNMCKHTEALALKSNEKSSLAGNGE